MGNVKFVPNLDMASFEKIIYASKANRTHNTTIQYLWEKCKNHIFNLTDQVRCLGFTGQGVTTYFSDNCNQNDAVLVTEWLKTKKYEGYIARTFKEVADNGQIVYDIKIASIETGPKSGITIEPETYKGATFKITRGDYSNWLALINSSLENAKKYAANEHEVNAITKYIQSFAEGDLEAHKDATRCV